MGRRWEGEGVESGELARFGAIGSDRQIGLESVVIDRNSLAAQLRFGRVTPGTFCFAQQS
jgi:hypothetical protein